MNAEDFRRIALSLEGADEGSHMGSPDFRVGGRIFATLASQSQGYGNLMLTPEQQTELVAEQPDVFVPIAGGWGRMGSTHIRLAATNEDVLAGALRTAWRLRIEKNAKKSGKKRASAVRGARKNKGKRRGSGTTARSRFTPRKPTTMSAHHNRFPRAACPASRNVLGYLPAQTAQMFRNPCT